LIGEVEAVVDEELPLLGLVKGAVSNQDVRRVLDRRLLIGDSDGIARPVGLSQRHESLSHAKNAGVDRGPPWLSGCAVHIDLADLSDLVARSVHRSAPINSRSSVWMITQVPSRYSGSSLHP
jgi:hypothetical protein